MLEATGIRANTLTLSEKVKDRLLDHPDIIDRLKYGQTPGSAVVATMADLARLFELDRILVSSAVENTAAQGAAAEHSFIAGRHALLTHSAPAPGLMVPSAGYTFSWNGYMGATGLGHRIKTFRMESLASDRVEIEMAFAMKRVAADLGVFFNNIVAS